MIDQVIERIVVWLLRLFDLCYDWMFDCLIRLLIYHVRYDRNIWNPSQHHFVFLKVVKIIETRARTVDVTVNDYYDILYAFHSFRGDVRRGIIFHLFISLLPFSSSQVFSIPAQFLPLFLFYSLLSSHSLSPVLSTYPPTFLSIHLPFHHLSLSLCFYFSARLHSMQVGPNVSIVS